MCLSRAAKTPPDNGCLGGVFAEYRASLGTDMRMTTYLLLVWLLAGRGLVLGNEIRWHAPAVLDVISVLPSPVTDLGRVERDVPGFDCPTGRATRATRPARHLARVRYVPSES